MSEGIKVGDKVRVSEDAPRIYTDGWRFDWRNSDSLVGIVEEDDAVISPDDSGEEELVIPCKYLVKVDTDAKEPSRIFYGDYAKVASQFLEELKRKAHPEWFTITEHTEQTEAEKKLNVGSIEIPVKLDFDESYWQNYEAQLAHDVAVKCAKQGTIDNPALADCVTALARKITESLKRK